MRAAVIGGQKLSACHLPLRIVNSTKQRVGVLVQLAVAPVFGNEQPRFSR